jgi:hypothetical protein
MVARASASVARRDLGFDHLVVQAQAMISSASSRPSLPT